MRRVEYQLRGGQLLTEISTQAVSMNDNFTLELRESYVVVQLAPDFELTPTSLARHWAAVIEFCRVHNCTRVLSQATNPRRNLSTLDAYDSAKTIAGSKLPLKIACRWERYEPDEMTRFFQTVAANRGLEIEFFPITQLALQWLGIQEGAGNA
ncbi:hypothetical protein [Anatilimnocola aggregata]|nr:hypothetical protein [Anatilimnocola aggregata]